MSEQPSIADYDAGVEPLQECERCRVMCAPGMACVSSQPGHPDAERPCRPEVTMPDAEKGAASSWMSAEATALYERAEALAEQRGCVIENDCWIECIDAAIEEVNSVLPPAGGRA